MKKNLKIEIIVVTVIVIFHSISCNNKQSQLDLFFAKIDHELSHQQKNQLKECQDIGCFREFAHYADSGLAEHFINMSNDIAKMLDSVGVLKDRELVLLIAYRRKINNKEYSFKEIEKSIQLYDENQLKEYNEWEDKFYNNLTNIAKTNFNKFSPGDTLCLLLPLERDTDPPNVVYYMQYDKDNFTDTLFVNCILLEKEMELKNEENNLGHDEVYFRTRVIFLSEPACLFLGEENSIGDVTRFSIFNYGRPIEVCD